MLHQGEVLQDIRAAHHVGFHFRVFLVRQPPHLVQHAVPDADLADIVHLGRLAQAGKHLAALPPFEAVHFLGDQHGILRHPHGMLVGAHVLGVDGVGDGHDRFIGHVQLDLLLVQLPLHHQPGEPDDEQGQQDQHVDPEPGFLVDFALFDQLKLALLQHALARAVENGQVEGVIPGRQVGVDDVGQAALGHDGPLGVIAL